MPGSNNHKHEVVVVTGASAGVGREIVRYFAGHGASIGLLARGPDRYMGTAAEYRAGLGAAVAIMLNQRRRKRRR